MTDNHAPDMPCRKTDTPFQRLVYMRSIDNMSYRQIASKGEFMGIPSSTIADIIKTGKIPKKYRKVFIESKPRVKHICQNCQAWEWTDEDAEGAKYGPCSSGEAPYAANQTDESFKPYADFGCIFWKRKESEEK